MPLFPVPAISRLVTFAFLLSAVISYTSQAQSTPPVTDNSQRTTLPGSHPPFAAQANDAGPIPASTLLHGITLVLAHTPVQEADLQTLLTAQQTPGSPLFHQWLTPEQFAARFGPSDATIDVMEAWLEQQGFLIDSLLRSRDRIRFSGTAAQFGQTFGAAVHSYRFSNGETHYAPSSALSVPSELADKVLAVTNVSDIRPRPLLVPARPGFTSGTNGQHFLTPADAATIYDVQAAYKAGYTGANQTIAVVGQSAIYPADITNFQNAMGLPQKMPTVVLMPNTGYGEYFYGDIGESSLDLEYTGSIAPNASIIFVYTGSNGNYNVFDALQYAVDLDIAPVISVSYGTCESNLSASDFNALNAAFEQAAAQGQSIIVASGDSGSTGCAGDTYLTPSQEFAVTADFPADSQYVTALGGTEFAPSAVATGNNTYFSPTTGGDVVSTALSYIPEQVWNDDSSMYGIASGGGGVSVFAPRPTWQAGVPGIPSGSYRLLPDISLDSSNVEAPYLYCTSDPSAWAIGQQGSCTNGFRDAKSGNLTAAGGTSFAAPIFAGLTAILNQAKGSTGQGLLNPTLYSLAANPSTYANAFHDITIGGNQCTAGFIYCGSAGGSSEYAAGVGYDEASGLGSIDFNQLLSVWPQSSTLPASATTLSAAATTSTTGTNDTITISVAAANGAGPIPTGSISLLIDGVSTSALSLNAGTATYTFNSAVPGYHIVVAMYSGDANYAPSRGEILLDMLEPSQVLLTPDATTVGELQDDVYQMTVLPATGTGPAATGILNVTTDGALISYRLTEGFVMNGFISPTPGQHTISASYLGDINYLPSSSSIIITVVTSPQPGKTTVTLTPSSSTVSVGVADAITIKVAPASGSTATPAGTVSVEVDGVIASDLPLSNGVATYTFSSSVVGIHPIIVDYQGDANFAANDAILDLTVSTSPAITLSATTLTVVDGSSASSTITVTPSGGYTGTLTFAVTGLPANSCYGLKNLAVTGTTAASATLTVYTSSSLCAQPHLVAHSANLSDDNQGKATMAGFLIVGSSLLLIGFRRRKRIAAIACFSLLATIGIGVLGCGGGGNTSGSGGGGGGGNALAPSGTYTLTVTGTDTATSSISANTTMSLTIQ